MDISIWVERAKAEKEKDLGFRRRRRRHVRIFFWRVGRGVSISYTMITIAWKAKRKTQKKAKHVLNASSTAVGTGSWGTRAGRWALAWLAASEYPSEHAYMR